MQTEESTSASEDDKSTLARNTAANTGTATSALPSTLQSTSRAPTSQPAGTRTSYARSLGDWLFSENRGTAASTGGTGSTYSVLPGVSQSVVPGAYPSDATATFTATIDQSSAASHIPHQERRKSRRSFAVNRYPIRDTNTMASGAKTTDLGSQVVLDARRGYGRFGRTTSTSIYAPPSTAPSTNRWYQSSKVEPPPTPQITFSMGVQTKGWEFGRLRYTSSKVREVPVIATATSQYESHTNANGTDTAYTVLGDRAGVRDRWKMAYHGRTDARLTAVDYLARMSASCAIPTATATYALPSATATATYPPVSTSPSTAQNPTHDDWTWGGQVYTVASTAGSMAAAILAAPYRAVVNKYNGRCWHESRAAEPSVTSNRTEAVMTNTGTVREKHGTGVQRGVKSVQFAPHGG